MATARSRRLSIAKLPPSPGPLLLRIFLEDANAVPIKLSDESFLAALPHASIRSSGNFAAALIKRPRVLASVTTQNIHSWAVSTHRVRPRTASNIDMSAPRTKRQFAGAASDPAQRQITSFFSKTSSSADTLEQTTPLSPPLPAQVQANLLSVGMRIRKSVPEGYKTGKLYSGFSLWVDDSASSMESASISYLPMTGAPPAGSTLSSQQELLPFCGIHKVGGLAVQPEVEAPSGLIPLAGSTKPALPIPPPTAGYQQTHYITNIPEADDIPSLTSSQDSVLSTDSEPPFLNQASTQPPTGSSKKRVYTEDTSTSTRTLFGDPAIIWRDRRDWLDGEVSPRSLAPAGWEKNARVMAVPKGVRKIAAGRKHVTSELQTELEQENMVAVVASAPDDFEEAEFLDRRFAEGGEMEVDFE